MAKLIYSAIASLDGYIEDSEGRFDWAEPDAEVHAFVNELERSIGTYLYGRRMYETMVFWETEPAEVDPPPVMSEFAALWRGADKIVYSRTLDAVSSTRTRLERTFDPGAVRHLKATVDRDITVGGAGLAGAAIAAGLVDEFHLLAVPAIVGGGKRWLPGGVRIKLALTASRRFASGVVYSSYETRS